jgi:hypothetical protein
MATVKGEVDPARRGCLPQSCAGRSALDTVDIQSGFHEVVPVRSLATLLLANFTGTGPRDGLEFARERWKIFQNPNSMR